MRFIPTSDNPVELPSWCSCWFNLQSPTIVEKTLALMKQLGPEPIPDWSYLVSRNAGYGGTVGKMLSDMPPSRGISLCLRAAQRQEWLGHCLSAASTFNS